MLLISVLVVCCYIKLKACETPSTEYLLPPTSNLPGIEKVEQNASEYDAAVSTTKIYEETSYSTGAIMSDLLITTNSFQDWDVILTTQAYDPATESEVITLATTSDILKGERSTNKAEIAEIQPELGTKSNIDTAINSEEISLIEIDEVEAPLQISSYVPDQTTTDIKVCCEGDSIPATTKRIEKENKPRTGYNSPFFVFPQLAPFKRQRNR